jgi:hypothetical protein
MNHDQMMQTDALQHASYIRQTPQQASYAQQETHQTTYTPQIPTIPQQYNYTLSTYPKQKQQAEHQPKQQTSHKQNKAWTAMTMTTGYPGKKWTRPRTTKVQTMKKNKLQETTNHHR